MADFGAAFAGGAVGAASISVVIKAIDNYSKELKSAQTSFQKFGVISAGVFATVGTAAAGFAIKSLKEFAESEKIIKRVELSYGSLSKKVIQASSDMQATSVEADDVIMQGFVDLQRRTEELGLSFEQQSQIIQGALDLSATTGMDFASVLDITAAGLMGQTRGLKQLGIQLEEGATPAQVYTEIMTKMGEATGASASATTTLSGQIAQLNNEFSDIKESVGQELAPAFTELTDTLKENKSEIVTLFTTIGNSLAWTINKVIEGVSEVVDFITLLYKLGESAGGGVKKLFTGDFVGATKGVAQEQSGLWGDWANQEGDFSDKDNTQAKEENTNITTEETEKKKELTDTQKLLLEQNGVLTEQTGMINELDKVNIKNTGDVNSGLKNTTSNLKEFGNALRSVSKGGGGGGGRGIPDALGLGMPTSKAEGFARYGAYQSAGLIKSYKKSDGTWSDFMQRPGQPATSFSPDDTIIGVKDPSKLGGKGLTINIGTIQGLSAEAISKALVNELKQVIAY